MAKSEIERWHMFISQMRQTPPRESVILTWSSPPTMPLLGPTSWSMSHGPPVTVWRGLAMQTKQSPEQPCWKQEPSLFHSKITD